MRTSYHENPFKLKFSFDDPVRQKLSPLVESILEHLISFHHLQRWYTDVSNKRDNRHFFDKMMDLGNIRYVVSGQDLSRIPKNGAVVVVANHPFGAIEGVILAAILRSIRPDANIMANYLLGRIEEIRDLFFFVDPFQGSGSSSMNKKALKEMLQLLRQGGVLGVFPAGEVAHFDLRHRCIKESKWNEQIARMIRKTKSPVLPVYFKGANSLLFHLLGLVHPFLRTAMIPRELANKRGKSIEVKIGGLIPFRRLEVFDSDAEMLAYLNYRTLMLKNRDSAPKAALRSSRNKKVPLAPIIPSPGKDLLMKEISKLPPEQALIEDKEHVVFYAEALPMPALMQEIGRLREITFRETGEGSGNSIDLDSFDKHYLHLFVWNKRNEEVVGAYRLGQTDRILAESGKEGLYTSTLFNFRGELLKEIDPALELGRAFVRAEYRKTGAPLHLLWKGIGKYLSRNPRYRFLFGPVSISNEYHSISRRLLMEFLKAHKYDEKLARLVKARISLRSKKASREESGVISKMVKDVNEISELISDIEHDRKGVPPLMKLYLALGGRFLGFNLDPKFSNVLDGLILVDLTRVDRRILEYYMGREEAANFLASSAAG
jgi:putative hemolysin